MILDTFSKFGTLNKEHNAKILAHYYQDPDIQDAADFMGDSLALAKQATQTNAEKMKPEITLLEVLRIHALIPLKKMLALS